jgi:transposase InsO family protein
MRRQRSDALEIDISTWPDVDVHEISDADRSVFLRRRSAIELYVVNTPLRLVEERTGINRRQLYFLLSRCLATDADGRVVGFPALLKYRRLVQYTRTAPLPRNQSNDGRGLGGAFTALLEQHPALAHWLTQKIHKRAVILHQVSTDGPLKSRLSGLGNLHAGFLVQCRAVGITANDYPLNTERMGIRALSSYVTAKMLVDFGDAARAAGAHHLKGMPASGGRCAAVRPYQLVEFDGHRLDIRLKIVVRDPLGFEQEFEIERVWLLVIIDVCTRAVLGYHLVLSREYSRYDVIKTIEQALAPHRPRTFALPGIGYGFHGGFPSGKLPELAYAIWERMRLDNANANVASDTMTALCEFVGCVADMGPPHHPDDRPYIERFFGTVASTLSSRLPGYTGSNPKDLRRALADPKGNLRLFVSFSEMEELMEAAIAGYNATPHAGLNGRTPLEAMEYLVRGKAQMIWWLPEAKRRTMCLMQTAHRCRVRGYLAQGTRPHINLFQVRYTSDVLAASAALLGRDLRIYYNSDDLRTVRAFLADGSELGVLKAQGAWGEIRHDLKLRREIMKLRARKRLTFTITQEFIDRFVDQKRKKAKYSRRAASDLERTMRALVDAPTANTTSARTAVNSVAPVPTAAQGNEPAAQTPSVEPQKLSIGYGYTTVIYI